MSTFGSGHDLCGLLHPRVALAAVTAPQATFEGRDCDALEPPRPARRALATFPGQLSRSRRSLKCLSQSRDLREGARQPSRPAGKALLVPQGGALHLVLRPNRDWCAALAARVDGCLRAAERVLPRASQARARGAVQAGASSWALSARALQAAHGHVRLVRVGCRH